MKRIVVDVDGVLAPCVEYACAVENARHGKEGQLRPEDFTKWGPFGDKRDAIFKWFQEKTFWEKQPLYTGARQFAECLHLMGEVFIVSAIPKEFAKIRREKLQKAIPFLDEKHILCTDQKSDVACDVIIDDAIHNLEGSSAPCKVMIARPWNQGYRKAHIATTLPEARDLVAEYVFGKES